MEGASFRMDIRPEMDFANEFFHPQKVLEPQYLTLQYPNVKPYNIWAECHPMVFNQTKRHRNNINKSDVDFYNSAAAQDGSQYYYSQPYPNVRPCNNWVECHPMVFNEMESCRNEINKSDIDFCNSAAAQNESQYSYSQPYPNVTPYNNWAECHPMAFNEMERCRNNINKSDVDFCNSAADQNGSQDSYSQSYLNVTPYNNWAECHPMVFSEMKTCRNNINKSDVDFYNTAADQSGSRNSFSQGRDFTEDVFKDQKKQFHCETKETKWEESNPYYNKYHNLRRNRKKQKLTKLERFTNRFRRTRFPPPPLSFCPPDDERNPSPKTDTNPEMDFASEIFNPQKVLKADYVTLPYPNVTPYNNLAEYHSVVFNKRKRHKNQQIRC